MELLRLLENIRTPVLDEIMLKLTELGGEIPLILLALIFFWCIDKRKAYYIISVGFLGLISNQFLKMLCRVPRPWLRDGGVHAVEAAKEGAGGYSFPSGHSQNAVGIFGSIAAIEKNKVVRILCILACLVVPFTRLYLGVHTLADVLAGAAMAVVLIFVMRPLIFSKDGKGIPYVLIFLAVLSAAYLAFVYIWPNLIEITEENLESGMKNAYTMVGCLSGFLVAYYVDVKWIHFSEKAVWWAQIIKVAAGLLIVLAIRSGLSAPLANLLGENPGRMVRYFLIVVAAGVVWPLVFRFFPERKRG